MIWVGLLLKGPAPTGTTSGISGGRYSLKSLAWKIQDTNPMNNPQLSQTLDDEAPSLLEATVRLTPLTGEFGGALVPSPS